MIYVFAPTQAAGNWYIDGAILEPTLGLKNFIVLESGIAAERYLRGRPMHSSDKLVFLEAFDEVVLVPLAQVCMISEVPQFVEWRDSRPIGSLASWLVGPSIPDLRDQRAVEEWLAS